MKKSFLKFFKNLFYILSFSLIIISCNSNDANESNTIVLSEVFNALGGEENIKNMNSISYKSTGASYEHEQAGPHVADPLVTNTYQYNFTSLLNKRKVKFEFDNIDFLYPFTYLATNGKAIINDKHGTYSGNYSWRSYYLGLINPTGMWSATIEADLKNQMMANPIELLKQVYLNNGINHKTKTNSFFVPTIVDNIQIEIKINPETKLPIKASVKELDFLKGDCTFEVEYLNWITINGIKYPSKISYKFNGKQSKLEDLSNIILNPSLPENNFNLEETPLLSYNIDQAKKGVISSQWHHRLFAAGLTQDQPFNNGALLLEEYDLTNNLISDQYISENIKIMGRPDSFYWSIAIRTPAGIHLVEAPLSPDWTRSIINLVKYKFPGEDIISIIPTHTHYDHFGGIKEAATEVDKIYIAHQGRKILDKALKSPNTIYPGAFTPSTSTPAIEEITGVTYIDNGAIQLHLLKQSDNNGKPFTVGNSHSEDMILVYIPAEKVLIQTDFLFGGGFLNIYNGKATNPFAGNGRVDFRNRGVFLRQYIEQKGLQVKKIIGIHGGVATMNDLIDVTSHN
jgi:glyoxylase-like metal-dependent hydrolase (beta-lactamase superfamily II)